MNKYENTLDYGDVSLYFYDLKKVFQDYPNLRTLPTSLKILLESNIRHSNDFELSKIIEIFLNRNPLEKINFYPNRILMQDYTGIPILVDFASIREEIEKNGSDANKIYPRILVDLVIDHSLKVDSFGVDLSQTINLKNEIQKNKQRYHFIKWASNNIDNLSVVPPGNGVCHQINLEFLSTIISIDEIEKKNYIFPESIVGTDSHTSMVNSLGVLGFEIKGLDAQSLMLGSPLSIKIPKVLGINLIGNLQEGINANDIIFSLINILKENSIEEKYIEFFGEGLEYLSLEDRATISNMAYESGAIVSYFSFDSETCKYIEKTRGVDVNIIKEYFIRQDLFHVDYDEVEFDEVIDFDLSEVSACVAGPKTPQDRVKIEKITSKLESFKLGNNLRDNDIVLASINSCLSTSNPYLIIQAGLLAKNAYEKGLDINSNIKTSLSLGSIVVKNYLEKLDLLKYFDKLGFNIVGFACANCFGNSGSLLKNVEDEIKKYNLNVSSVSSSNSNFEKKIHPLVKSNWLMSPALVIAYSLKGSVNFNIKVDPISKGIYLKDIWPSNNLVNEYINKIDSKIFLKSYNQLFLGNYMWQEIPYDNAVTYNWDEFSTFIKPTNLLDDIYLEKININNSKILAVFGNDVSSDDIAASGEIKPYSLCADYLNAQGVFIDELGSYESRRANAEVMVRGSFDNENIKNLFIKKQGAFTKDFDEDEIISFYEFSLRMKEKNTSLVIFAGENYGIGNARGWAAKGTKLLGVKVVIAQSFNELHKNNLIDLGILPLELIEESIDNLNLKGNERVNIYSNNIIPNEKFQIEVIKNGNVKKVLVKSRLDNLDEVIYYKNGGKLSYLVKNMIEYKS